MPGRAAPPNTPDLNERGMPRPHIPYIFVSLRPTPLCIGGVHVASHPKIMNKIIFWERLTPYLPAFCVRSRVLISSDSLLYESPGGNQVDGLPPASSSGQLEE